jgi:small-conductance mechanosensitive channel
MLFAVTLFQQNKELK